ncbi:DEAD/DEAH box helicase [Methylobacterium brachiatum]|uniref:DEAD/DEAH box helicase n=1 Tax=Methylobacterium brachiatum TaxID=269660 RepID=UPI0008E22C7F|nr:DEAD/DEAH box helicase [Methylobacterium brachiatum]SFJ68885.1 Helicase conserved C-terminal domain-containing protein [Methylobacterium brachiatum]
MQLKPWQETGARWLAARERALLADGMRVGKTPQTIAAADYAGAESILIVCPGIARENWAREFDRFSIMGRPVAVVHGARDRIEPNGVTILSMDGARNGDLYARVMAHRWDVLTVDEAQYLKNPESQRTRQVLSARGFAAQARRIWFLTGTPMLNHPGELWIILRTCGRFAGSYTEFLDRFTVWFMGDFGPVVRALRDVDGLRALLEPVMLRRMWHEVSPDTPSPVWGEVRLDPGAISAEAKATLAAMEADGALGGRLRRLVERIGAGEKVELSKEAGGLTQLRSATAVAKAGPVAAWAAAELGARRIDKLVVFGHHTAMVEQVADRLAPFGAATIHGGTPMKQRQRNIDGFASDPARRVLVCQDQVARTAIDLTAASHLLFGELDWVPDNNAQAAMRVQGPRQTRPVHIHAAYLPGSSDEGLARILARKTKMAAEIFG